MLPHRPSLLEPLRLGGGRDHAVDGPQARHLCPVEQSAELSLADGCLIRALDAG